MDRLRRVTHTWRLRFFWFRHLTKNGGYMPNLDPNDPRLRDWEVHEPRAVVRMVQAGWSVEEASKFLGTPVEKLRSQYQTGKEEVHKCMQLKILVYFALLPVGFNYDERK